MLPRGIEASKEPLKGDEDLSIEAEDIDFKEAKRRLKQEEDFAEPWYFTHF